MDQRDERLERAAQRSSWPVRRLALGEESGHETFDVGVVLRRLVKG